MKRLLFIFMLILVISSCKKENGKEMLSPDAKVAITGVNSLNTTYSDISSDKNGIDDTGVTDSLAYIVKYAWEISSIIEEDTEWARGVSEGEYYYQFRDLEKNKLLFWATDAIENDKLSGLLMQGSRDYVITVLKYKKDTPEEEVVDPLLGWSYIVNIYADCKVDTVGYVPNSNLQKIRNDVLDALTKEDYDTCYKLFNDGFVFTPTTGEKWRKMKEAGIE